MAVASKQKFTRAHLDALMDSAIEENGSIIIHRPGRKDVAIVAAEKLRQLDTTDYLLASPKNRRRLRGALGDARAAKGRTLTVSQLRHLAGLKD